MLLRWCVAGGGCPVVGATASSPFLHEEVMSGPLIALTGLIYAYVALEQFWRGNHAMGTVYCGYAFSNVGLYLLAR